MPDVNDFVDPIPTRELERRWKLVRSTMAERGIDVLLTQASNSCYGGYLRWFTDVPAHYGTYASALFPQDEPIILFHHGADMTTMVPANSQLYRGIGRIVTRPTFASAYYTENYHAEATVEELRRLGARKVGVVSAQMMAYPYLAGIKAGLPDVSFVDATDFVDAIKAIKSADEIDLIRRCALQQDAAWSAVLSEVRPGKRVQELVATAQYVGETMGAYAGVFLAAAGPLGKPAPKGPRHMQNHVLQDGDQFTLLIENNGPGGQYCEIGRTCVIGKASQSLLDEFDFVLEAQRFMLDLIRPGASPAEILARYNAFMRQNGRQEETRINTHGQGYDLVERPLFVPEETMLLAEGMNLAVHPTYLTEREYSWVCDNYLVTATGVSECLHRTEQKIFEI